MDNAPLASIYDIPLTTLDGAVTTLADQAGKLLLIVNVASRCGFTPQYAGLEALHRRYQGQGFAVLGFPCDQFGHQEPGSSAEIRHFCQSEYAVSFPLFAKIEVNGPAAHPLYRHLKQAAPGLLGSQRVKWNFTKFLVAPDGRVIARYAPITPPARLERAVQRHLPS